jgi:ATP-dependent Clp protease ATP-binding subunit ClpC
MAERELSLNLSEDAKDLLVEKGWDPAMGARPLRRAIQRYIEDPLADEVLKTSMEPGSTVEIDKKDTKEGEEADVKIRIIEPQPPKVPAGVGAKGDEAAEGEGDGGSRPEGSGGDGLPDDPEVLPEVPDAPPEDGGEGAAPAGESS